MADNLQRYLKHVHDLGQSPTEIGFKQFKDAGPPRETHPEAFHSRYTDALGNPFGVAGRTTEDDLRRQREVQEANARRAKPFPASYGLQADDPEHRARSAAHGQEIVAAIRAGEQGS